MQTFLPYISFEKTASILDRMRLGCQRKETKQILTALRQGPFVVQFRDETTNKWKNFYGEVQTTAAKFRKSGTECRLRTTPWFNHPNVQLWKSYELPLVRYGVAICDEWIKRGYVDNTKTHILSFLSSFPDSHSYEATPEWLDEDFCVSHRKLLLVKNPEFYAPVFPSLVLKQKKLFDFLD